MKSLIIVLATLILGAGCAASNKFEQEKIPSSNLAYINAKKYCEKHSPEYDECMDEQYSCIIEASSITGSDFAANELLDERTEKAIQILKMNHAYQEWVDHDMGYCELLELYQREW